ncbi:zf-C3HC4-domain-containing protein [Laetiporus sulphureus 93-53]|uniref:Zf-C3HC4-domain-containing protein n=1 Tax=Laetiporus sulphureus 93-53 TaxID=1314785 RepID=A0A165E0F2_9APHY|nr:zf-C3HC4-domain-containing protein [Laetiporus sulphureus 93-53]KZT06006.1 zf-C3HC4-domain-containing protein [Laetiporus sulphureus 93-53]
MSDPETTQETKQCRICFEGEDPDLGRLIRPCLCKGTISHVHVKCLQRWRNSSANHSAFYSCPQCGYKYHFARTRVVGIATNPVAVAVVSSFLFTILVMCSSFVTTSLLSDEGDSMYLYGFYSPLEVIQNLVRATISIFVDDRLLDEAVLQSSRRRSIPTIRNSSKPPGLLKRFVRRFLLGLPVVGAGSIAHMLLSVPLPFHWVRFRAYNRGRDSRDLVALFIVAIVLMGAARALYKVFKLTEKLTKRLLLRAEDAILEVN